MNRFQYRSTSIMNWCVGITNAFFISKYRYCLSQNYVSMPITAHTHMIITPFVSKGKAWVAFIFLAEKEYYYNIKLWEKNNDCPLGRENSRKERIVWNTKKNVWGWACASWGGADRLTQTSPQLPNLQKWAQYRSQSMQLTRYAHPLFSSPWVQIEIATLKPLTSCAYSFLPL